MRATAVGTLVQMNYWCGFQAAKVDTMVHGSTYSTVHTLIDALEVHAKKCKVCAGKYWRDA